MPNYGRLDTHLIGNGLSIRDKLVIDENWNLCVGNVTSGNICGSLIATDIIEKDPAQGINFFGNVNIQEGFFVTGNVDLTGVMFVDFFTSGNIFAEGNINTMSDLNVSGTSYLNGGACITGLQTDVLTGKTFGVGPIITGNSQLLGSFDIIGGPLSSSQIFCDGLCTDVLLLNTMTPKAGNDIDVLEGNINIVGSPFFFCGDVKANVICSNNPGVPLNICGGGMEITEGCFTLPKSTSGTDGENEVLTTTPAGIVQMTALGMSGIVAGDVQSVRLVNPCITSTSIVLATIGTYADDGTPIVQKTQVGAGDVDIFVMNIDSSLAIAPGTIIPIQYLIV